MIKSHKFSPNHKIVDKSPHSFHMPGNAPGADGDMHQSAEPAGGGAQGPAAQMFSDGGKACYADGGDILGGGIRGKMSDYGHALKDTYNQITTTAPKESPDANPVKDAQTHATQNQEKSTMDAVRKAETGE